MYHQIDERRLTLDKPLIDQGLAKKWILAKGWEEFYIDKGKQTVFRQKDNMSQRHLYTLGDAVDIQMGMDITASESTKGEA